MPCLAKQDCCFFKLLELRGMSGHNSAHCLVTTSRKSMTVSTPLNPQLILLVTWPPKALGICSMEVTSLL